MTVTTNELEHALGQALTFDQAAIAQQLYALYADRGLIRDGLALPLEASCRCGAACWRREGDALPPREKAGVSIPWVGEEYAQTRVCLLGINFNKDGGLDAHWRLTRSVIEHLRRGRKQVHESLFGHRAGTAAATVARGLPLPDRGSSTPGGDGSPADGWSRCAFLQLVRCAPWRGKSEPNETMWANCPNLYLVDELRILAPRVLIVFGAGAADDRLRSLGYVTRWDRDGGFQRGELVIGGLAIEVLGLAHPAAWGRDWSSSHEALVQSLAEEPLVG